MLKTITHAWRRADEATARAVLRAFDWWSYYANGVAIVITALAEALPKGEKNADMPVLIACVGALIALGVLV